ncbi:GNAT family N-acetyltransferase [Neobacillus sp. LXY-1]|uniref:GNAT family N-acetyltransferase n=1 Tax=Neobacillus sp. LXY-1 TaxID=3379133 RepID=UPI003EE20ECE
MVKDNQIIATVSVNILTILINGDEVPAIQIGTVMRDEGYQNKGYSRLLMEKVLEDYSHIPFMYLFANDTVLDFYPKFGFRHMEETIFSCNYMVANGCPASFGKLDGTKQEDLEFIYKKALTRKPNSALFSTTGTEELVMFYAIKIFPQNCYWIDEEQAIVMCQHQGSTLHIYDIISKREVNITTILETMTTEETRKITFHFTPTFENLTYTKKEFSDHSTFFIRITQELNMPLHFKHPNTSQA